MVIWWTIAISHSLPLATSTWNPDCQMTARNNSLAPLFVPRDYLGLDLDLNACKVPTVASCKVPIAALVQEMAAMNLFSRLIKSWTSNKSTGESYYHYELATSDLDDNEHVEYNRSAASLRIATKTRLPTSRVITLSLALGGLQFFWSTIMANLVVRTAQTQSCLDE